MKKLLVASSVALCFALPATGWAHGSCKDDPNHCAYWHNASGDYVRDSSGDCVRTDSWFAGSQVEGCDVIIPKDSDGDGVTDDMDKCPGTASGVPVDTTGCPLPQDDDKDGVVNKNDRCPNTPRGAQVNSRGCELDSDNDGVVNSKDQCPGTKAGAEVNAQGCEIVQFETVTIELQVNFALDSAVVTSAYSTQMEALAYVLNANPDTQVTIAGHTDSLGGAAYNQQLSERRAQAVKQHLVDNYDVNPNQLDTVGYGESRPIADNSTAEGRRLNRRVEAEVSGEVPQ